MKKLAGFIDLQTELIEAKKYANVNLTNKYWLPNSTSIVMFKI